MTSEALILMVDRSEVQLRETARMAEALQRLVSSPEIARANQERIELVFHGYDEDTRELWEITEVREFVAELDEGFPYWLFFCAQGPGLQCLLRCFLPPFLTAEAEARLFPARINDLFERRWGPAAEEVARFAGLAPPEIDALVARIVAYFSGDTHDRA